ncbi:hypothetical protein HZA86_04120 [Candidatus Uhrbacteria bacterium]|nr:hypothetical protein [Candidatus Uhrbacteria bacterium]
MLIDPQGIALDAWKKSISSGSASSPEQFVRAVQEARPGSSVFVDCTASEEIPRWYRGLLERGISVVTPNKKGNSGSLEQYRALQNASGDNGAVFRYETNVGAALPVIHTIKSLMQCGDEIIRIEAVLSGTLSYIFNTFASSNLPFSAIVRDAQSKGYTEPDPRDDLNGKDVARKILILAREMGLAMELADVQIEALLPAECFSAPSIEQFFTALETLNVDFESKKQLAAADNKKLCFVATLDNGEARIALTAVDRTHAMYGLSGSDNIVMFTTKRYNTTPLVIRGPGAGAEVTAGGVLADIIQCFKS